MIVDIVFLLHNDYGAIKDFITFRDMALQSMKSKRIRTRLVLLLKGFTDLPSGIEELADVAISVPNYGKDIASYFFYAEQAAADVFVFFNTSSKLKSQKFLSSAIESVLSDGVGLAGATGAFGGIVQPIYFVHLWRHGLCSLASALVKFTIAFLLLLILRALGYSSVPHVRTNSFAVRREVFINSKIFFRKKLNTRLNSLMFESGRRGLSGFVNSMGLEIIVVDANGDRFTQQAWMKSNTYAIGMQENLAVEDNRTSQYSKANPLEQKKLRLATWYYGG